MGFIFAWLLIRPLSRGPEIGEFCVVVLLLLGWYPIRSWPPYQNFGDIRVYGLLLEIQVSAIYVLNEKLLRFSSPLD